MSSIRPEMNKPRIGVVTLGCSKNIVDGEHLLAQLRVNNAAVVDDIAEADIAVINTCGFIEAAKQESLDAVVEALERKGAGTLKKVVVMGCLSERYRDELRKALPEVDAYFGSNHLREVVTELGSDFRRELLGERVLTTPGHFAYLKISEGCDRPCSFCAIPLMRGTHRTKPLEDVVREAQILASTNVKELILIGQDTTYYGLDLYGERRLGDLLRALDGLDSFKWIRLMYAYPSGFPHDVLSVFRDVPALCRYIDLPLQHVSDPVLRSMRRGMTEKRTRDLLERMHRAIPGLAIRTTFIVGYPNETDGDFQVLYDFVKEAKFHRMGVFAYSQEDGTAAEALGDPVPEAVKQERLSALMELQRGISEERNAGLAGSVVRVLIDRIEGEYAVGRTEWDAPEIDQEIYVKGAETFSPGNFYDVRIVEGMEYDLYAEGTEDPVPRKESYEVES